MNQWIGVIAWFVFLALIFAGVFAYDAFKDWRKRR